MNTEITIDAAGRVIIPKALRDRLQLAPGDTLSLESTGERITLQKQHARPPLAKEKGVWVFRTGQPLPASATDDALLSVREGRGRDDRGV